MRGNILVLAECAGQEVSSVTVQLAGKGRELARSLGCQVDGLILGHGLDTLTQLMRGLGFDTVFVADDPALATYNPELYAHVVADFVRDADPCILLCGYTPLGMEIGPAVAARLGLRLISNCVDFELLPDKVVVTRPMYGGLIHARVESTRTSTTILSVPKSTVSARAQFEGNGTIKRIHPGIPEMGLRTRVIGPLVNIEGGDDLRRADVIVAAGRGIRDKANLRLIEALADAVGGVVGCSRPLIDNGWLPPGRQIGLTGTTVHPKVYIACGISGAPQHVAGMSDSQMIIAINEDPKAPIFRVAHYGVVGDLLQVIPALIEASKVLK